jgi:very-short-patch-repair endonuclease
MKRAIIPYNQYLKELAKKLRRNMTYSEVMLWNEIKNGKLKGYDFDRQRPIGNYIVDFTVKICSWHSKLTGSRIRMKMWQREM